MKSAASKAVNVAAIVCLCMMVSYRFEWVR